VRDAVDATRRRRRAPRWWRSLLRRRAALVGLVLVAGAVAMGALAPLIALHEPLAGSLRARLLEPGTIGPSGRIHLLGTDSLGRDVWSQIVYGARISLSVGVLSVLLGGSIGIALGLVSAMGNRLLDAFLMRLADVQLSFPSFLLALALLAVFGPGLWNVILVLAIAEWVQYARVMRAQALQLGTLEYVEAARALGARRGRVMLKHILPNGVSPLVVIASFGVARAIIAESSLSFLGVGVSPDVPTWGGILARGRDYVRDAWWLVTAPGVAIALTVLGINLVGDWLRDVLDPKGRP
jgi:peptide/nickel transport system permease protein